MIGVQDNKVEVIENNISSVGLRIIICWVMNRIKKSVIDEMRNNIQYYEIVSGNPITK